MNSVPMKKLYLMHCDYLMKKYKRFGNNMIQRANYESITIDESQYVTLDELMKRTEYIEKEEK